MSQLAIGARQIATEVLVGDLVTIERPAGTYRWLGDKEERPHRSRPVLITPTRVALIREVTERRPEAWVVLANRRAYPASWIKEVVREEDEDNGESDDEGRTEGETE